MSKNARSENIITPEGRGSFLHLFDKEKKRDGTDGSHSMSLLIPKKSDDWRKDLPELWKAIKPMIAAQFPDKASRPPIYDQDGAGKPWPVKDGDAPNGNGVVREESKGHWVVRFISRNFDPSKNLLNGETKVLGKMTDADCFSGCYFKVQTNAFFYNVDGSIGISMGMNNVMFTKTGERFGDGGGADAASAFGVEAVESSAATAFDEEDAFEL